MNGSANNSQKYEIGVGKSRLLLAQNVSYLCRNRSSEKIARDVRLGSLADLFRDSSSMAANGRIADMFKARARYDNYMQIDLDSFPLAL